MWIFWAVVAMLGSTVWYMGPKFFTSQNPFSPLVIAGLGGILVGLLGSKLFYRTWFDSSAMPLGIFYAFTWFATIGFILALNAGGRIGPVAVIIESSLILATLMASFLLREQLHWLQMIGIFVTVVGLCLVLYFEKK